ncbi:hypothetical protein [Asticcacaulis sp. EMRT-3]|uniref:hypothetical protein n=1 Tax=Asticcacaulis sp. EMRT-3 TaxID=3040349 RepID=UPI0024AECDEA|nr:hypothetical protein [Asticcacaulis sp. EMRT-3]MDI7775450.1 hypothetical protein [Asticcacaulis sp. EMRT-3]
MYLYIMEQNRTQTGMIKSADLLAGFNALVRERDEYIARAHEINDRLEKIAVMLGISTTATPSHHVKRNDNPPIQEDVQSMSMGEYARFILSRTTSGLSRKALRTEMEKNPKFRERIENQVNVYYNTIGRYVKSDRIIDLDGTLYHPNHAPAHGPHSGHEKDDEEKDIYDL